MRRRTFVAPVTRPPTQLLDRPAGEQLGLGPGDEHPGADRDLDVAEADRAGQVLERLAGRAAVDERVVLLQRGGADVLDRDQAGAGGAEDVREQRLGVVLRAGDTGLPEALPRGHEHSPALGHCSSASSRAARSASMQESRTGWSSPSSTWSRL